MPHYQVREVKIVDPSGGELTEALLREYERQSTDNASIIEQVRRFFEIELSSPKALQTVDFDAITVIASNGSEIARFDVSDFWCREWRDSALTAKVSTGKLPKAIQQRSR
jgi:hypothetical protein